jgi:aryl-alcohol dehydrogenase-like predicted oxidoreductase
MKYRRLGQSGLFVSELCLGTMTFGGHGRHVGPDRASFAGGGGHALVKTALDAGINFIDTANVYAGGRSERSSGRR